LHPVNEEEFSVDGQTPVLYKESSAGQKAWPTEVITKEEKAKIEKSRTRIELFEKQLPMRKMTIAEWVKLVKAGEDEEVTSIGQERVLEALRQRQIWKEEEGSVFARVIRESQILRD